jgi:putative endonuclease
MTRERPSDLRRAAERRGRRGELLAVAILVLKGYRILGRRVRTRVGEIDIVARSPRGILCFIEVKARSAMPDAREALQLPQQSRIEHAAELYLAQWNGLKHRGVRFDTIAIAGRTWPQHVRDAWRPRGR